MSGPAGWVNGPYVGDAPDALVPRQAGLDVGGAVKTQPQSLDEADAENLAMVHRSIDLPPVGDAIHHVSRHLAFLKTPLAQAMSQASIDRLIEHIHRHVDTLRPWKGPVTKDGFDEAADVAMMMADYKGK